MANEPLSIRIPADLMAQVRGEIESSQTNLTATVARLLTEGLSAKATSALLSSRLEEANSEIGRLKAANNSTFSAPAVTKNAETGVTVIAHDDHSDYSYRGNRGAGGYAYIRSIIADRQRWVLRGAAFGAALLMIALVPMPYDWWFPQLIAKASMGGSGIDPGARLIGYDNGVQMLVRVCPIFERRLAEYDAKLEKAKNLKQRGKAKADAAKPKAGRRTAKGER